jgi:multidrug efflux pump
MGISDICIRRPVLSIVLSLLIVTSGLIALEKLPLRHLPAYDEPAVTVVTALPGASAGQIEAQVSAVLEDAIGAIAGVRKITSTSVVGESIVQVTFRDDADPLNAANEVGAKAQATLPQLPPGTQAPVVTLASADDGPILYLGVRDPRRSALELTDLARDLLRPELTKIDGVAKVDLIGERRYAMIVELDPVRLAAEGLTVSDVVAAINAHNSSAPSGQIEVDRKTTTIVTHAALADVRAFEEAGIQRRDGYTIRISDVGRARIGPEEETSAIFVDGGQGLALSISARPHANPLQIAAATRALLPRLQSALPEGASLEVIFDTTVYIGKAVGEVFDTIMIAVLLVIATTVLFLGNLRSSLIVMVTIPVSLVGALALLMPLGFSLNTFTLLAIVLAVGLVVDDAIIDVENVERHIASGRSPIEAAFIGSREVSMAVIATTATLAAIYAPIGFMPGKVGHLFREFGFTLAIAVVVSGFVSRTLSPMMCSRLLRAGAGSTFQRAVNAGLDRAADAYRRLLGWVLSRRLLALGALTALMAAFAVPMASMPFELAPEEDQGYIMAQLSAEPGTTLDDMIARSRPVEQILAAIPEAAHTLVIIGQQSANSGMAILMLKPWSQRTRGAAEIRQELNTRLATVGGVSAIAFPDAPLGGGGGFPIEMVVKTTGAYEDLYTFADAIKADALRRGIVSAASLDLDFGAPKLAVAIDRATAQQVGIDPAAISNTLASMLTGARASDFNWKDALYPVIVRMAQSETHSLNALDHIHLRSDRGDMIPLASLIATSRHVGALSLGRQDQQRAVKIMAVPGSGQGTAEATAALERLIRDGLPSGMSLTAEGAQQETANARRDTTMVFALALLIVFLLLSAQFESFRDPAIILVAAPFAILGGMAGLVMAQGTLNAYTAIALVTLVGMIAKHGILITEFANQARDEGMALREALLDAAGARFRPILMTTAAAIAGALPLLAASGPGANSRAQIGIVIVTGMAVGTLVSMVLVPIGYSLISARQRAHLVEPPLGDLRGRSPSGGGTHVLSSSL